MLDLLISAVGGFLILILLSKGLKHLAQASSQNSLFVTVYDWEYALLYVDGRFTSVLPPGRHFNFDLTTRRNIYTLHRSAQLISMLPLDVTSVDKLPFRLSATVTYEIKDPREAFENPAHEAHIRLAVTQALAKLAAEQSLDSFMTQRADLHAKLFGMLPSPISGCAITSVVITSVVLPPEVRRMFTEVERAKFEGLAALERARGEHAALRSLANAARMLKGNPELMNLRVLQALSDTQGKRQATLVLGQGALLPVGGAASPSEE